MNVEVEGNELVLQNNNGDTAIIPKHLRSQVLKHLEEGNHSAIDDIIEGLPLMSDYAAEGSIMVNPIDPPTTPVTSGEPTPTPIVNDLGLPVYTGVLDTKKKYDKDKLFKTLLANQNYSTSGKGTFSEEEFKTFKESKEGVYSDDSELIEAVNKSNRISPILYKARSIADKKMKEYSNIDLTPQVESSITHFKKNYGKSNQDIYSVKSNVEGFKATPLHKDIYKRIVSSADEVGLDRYTALGLAMVESNYGKGYKEKNAGTIYENLMFSNWDGKVWPNNKELDLNSGPDVAFDSFLKSKKLDINTANQQELNQALKEFEVKVGKTKPLSKTGTGSALLYYKTNPKGYNSGNPNYVATVESAANAFRNDPTFKEWEKGIQ